MSRSKAPLLSRYQTMGNLASPIRSKLFNRHGNEHYRVSVCAMQGYRASMEDAHLVNLSFDNHPEYSLFGIFDGHNGRKAAHYLAQHLISRLNALPTLDSDEPIQNVILSMDEEFCNSSDGANGSTVVFAIVKPLTFSKSTNHNVHSVAMDSASSESEGDPPTPSGPEPTTPTTSTNSSSKSIPNKLEYEIRVFWAGDSRAVLIKSSPTNHDQFQSESTTNAPSDPTAHSNTSTVSTVTIPNDTDSDSTTTTESQTDRNQIRRSRPLLVELTNDHRPDNPSERKRIETAHGVVINNRVDSKLAVSRAFGDCTLKNNKSLQFRSQRVTSLTETRRIIASHGDELFLFCDGLVEYLDNERLIGSLYRQIPLYQDPVYALGFLFDEVLEGGSRDNMSAILVQFADGTSYGVDGRQRTFLPGPLYLTRNDKKYVAAYLSNAKDFGHRDSPQLRRAAYREDLKFLRKYGLQHHGNEKAIIREIQQVIRDIDAHTERQRVGDESKNKEVQSPQPRHRGSTEVIRDEQCRDEERHQEDDQEMKDSEYGSIGNQDFKDSQYGSLSNQDMTPPLSEVDDDEEEENEMELNVHSPNTSKSDARNDGDGKPQITRKRTYADLRDANQDDEDEESDNFTSKRRKSNLGNVIVSEHVQRSRSGIVSEMGSK